MFKKMLALVLVSMVIMGLFVNTAQAVDAPSQWAQEAVDRAIEAELVPEALKADYTKPTTRAEFCALATLLYENIVGEITERKSFTDTDDIDVEKMASLDVVNGVGDDKFDPDAALNREQAATILARLAKAMGMSRAMGKASFSDIDNISQWALDAVGQMQSTGLMEGVGDNTFSPKGAYTREQSIVVMTRLYDAMQLGSVTIIYNVNEGEDAPSDHEIKIAPCSDELNATPFPWQQISFTISETEPTRSGYTFWGWTSDFYPGFDIRAAGDVYYATGSFVADGLIITLSAQWVEEGTPVGKVTVVYDADGGDEAPPSLSVDKTLKGEAEIEITKVIPTKSGFNFLGWVLVYKSYIYEPGEFMTYTSELADLYEDDSITFTAVWEEDPV